MVSRFLPCASSQTSGRKYNTIVSIKCMMHEKGDAARHFTMYMFRNWETIFYFKWQKQGSLSSFRPLTGWVMHWFVWKPPFEQLTVKGDLSNATTFSFNPPLFSFSPLKKLSLILIFPLFQRLSNRRWFRHILRFMDKNRRCCYITVDSAMAASQNRFAHASFHYITKPILFRRCQKY